MDEIVVYGINHVSGNMDRKTQEELMRMEMLRVAKEEERKNNDIDYFFSTMKIDVPRRPISFERNRKRKREEVPVPPGFSYIDVEFKNMRMSE